MRVKKLSAFLLVIVMLCITFGPVAEAEDVNDYLFANGIINGDIADGEKALRRGSENVLSVQDVSYDGMMVEPNKISYQWYSGFDWNTEISDENSCEYSFTYQGEEGYNCKITVQLSDGSERVGSIYFFLREAWSGHSDLPYIERGDTLYLENVQKGDSGTLEVIASSDKNITYEWCYQADDWNYSDPKTINDAAGNTYTFTKEDIGTEQYTCFVDDGAMFKAITFIISSPDNGTLDIDPKINGEKVKGIDIGNGGVGYKYGVAVNKEVRMEINASTTSGSPITYKWIQTNMEGEGTKPEPKVVSEKDILTISKADAYHSTYLPADDGSVSGVEDYECWIEDGNVRKRVLISLYLTETKAETTKMSDGSELNVSVDNSDNITDNLNAFLTGDAKAALDNGQMVNQIRLETQEQTDARAEDITAISSVLAENSEVGVYLDINLSAEVHADRKAPAENIQIKETGMPVAITVDVPVNMINTDNTVDRTYEVIRVHDDKAESLDCEFKDNKITFSTDKFSTYALAYTDTKINAGAQETDSNNQNTGTSGSSQANASTQPEFKSVSAAAATGDMSNAGGYVIMLFASLGIISGILIKKKAVR